MHAAQWRSSGLSDPGVDVEAANDLASRAGKSTAPGNWSDESILRAVLDSTNNGIFFIGADLRILYANARVAELFGIDPLRLIGRDKRAVVTSEIAPHVSEPQAFTEQLFHLYTHPEECALDEVEVEQPTHRILERYSGPVYRGDGSLHGRIEVYTDVTDVRTLQRNKDEFLSLISHELKTPVTSIKGYAQLLQRRARREQLPEHMISAFEVIERQASRMQELIDMLLDLSRIETGRLALQIETVDLAAVVERAVDLTRITVDTHAIEVERPPTPALVQGDARRLEQVFVNLLANAVRFSPEKTSVRVAVIPDDDMVSVTVADQGAGIPADALPHIFERFYRSSGVSESTGMGIGLYISKNIVEEHGGEIAVQSSVTAGSIFTVTIPRGNR